MRKWRTLARIIDTDSIDGKIGCYAVFPAWNYRIAVFVHSVPPGVDLSPLRYGEPVRAYVMMYLGADHWEDLEPEWCE